MKEVNKITLDYWSKLSLLEQYFMYFAYAARY